MLNRLELIGNLGRDPELSYTPSGKPVCKFSVAVSRRYADAQGQKQEHTQWFNVVAWDKLAETCNTYLRKGAKVYLAGRMESRNYTDKDNVQRTAWELTASDMEMLDGKAQGEERGAGAGRPDAGAAAEDEVPF